MMNRIAPGSEYGMVHVYISKDSHGAGRQEKDAVAITSTCTAQS